MMNHEHHDGVAFQMLHVSVINFYCMEVETFLPINGMAS